LSSIRRLDVDALTAQLDRWAERVRFDTERHLYKFHDNPAEYENSEAFFRMLNLVTVLQLELGVHYNLDRVRDVDFTRSQDLFIHGMVDNDNGGTCVSMPVLYIAVGRRLGYPLKLVAAKAHLFCRWDGLRERVNIEGSSHGMNTYDDEYYKTWPLPMTDAEVRSGRFLKSLTPAEELATFLAARGHCLLDNGRTSEAQAAYAKASQLVPDDPALAAWQRQAEARQHRRNVASSLPPRVRPPRSPRPIDPLAELRRIERLNAENRRRMSETLRLPTPLTPPNAYGPQVPSPPIPQPGAPQPHRPSVPRDPWNHY